jgi:hypothetical protein
VSLHAVYFTTLPNGARYPASVLPEPHGYKPEDIYEYSPSEVPTHDQFDDCPPDDPFIEISSTLASILTICETPPVIDVATGLPRADALICTHCGARGHLLAVCAQHPVRVAHYQRYSAQIYDQLRNAQEFIEERDAHKQILKDQAEKAANLKFYRAPTPFPVKSYVEKSPQLAKRTVKKPYRFDPISRQVVRRT